MLHSPLQKGMGKKGANRRAVTRAVQVQILMWSYSGLLKFEVGARLNGGHAAGRATLECTSLSCWVLVSCENEDSLAGLAAGT